MNLQHERLEFAPPPTAGLVRAVALAIVVHAMLLVALTFSVQWKRDAAAITVQAELWSSIPTEAAPPPPPPEPVDTALEPPKPAVPAPEPAKPTPAAPDPAIAIAREKEKAKLVKEKQVLQEKLAAEKKKQEAEKAAKELAAKEKAAKDKLANEKAAKDKLAAKREQEETKKLADLRQQNLQRMAGMAGTSGDANSRGSAMQASGPSAGYAGRIRARIKPNITYTENISGNPTAEVEVRTATDGTIISRKLTKSSGVKSWDDAVLNAIDKTEVLPKDVDGTLPKSMVISFRPSD
jgi:colicin import membrane protein